MSALTVTTRKVSVTQGSGIRADSSVGSDGLKREWLYGVVATPWGLVSVYSQGGSRPYSAYTIVLDGREYRGSERVGRPKRGLALKAGQFARDCYGESVA